MTPLAAYLLGKQMTQRAFARLIAVPSPQVSMWCTGRRKPNLDNALAIERATLGAVPASYWPTTTASDSARRGGGRR